MRCNIFLSTWPLLVGVVFMVVVLFMRGGMVELIERAYRLVVTERRKEATA